jgi:hypothetical protein
MGSLTVRCHIRLVLHLFIMRSSDWQSAERVSVRLAARGTAPPDQLHHYQLYQAANLPNDLPPCYGQSASGSGYGAPVYSQQIPQQQRQQLTPPQSPAPNQSKRRSEEPQDDFAVKPRKKARAKNLVNGTQGKHRPSSPINHHHP